MRCFYCNRRPEEIEEYITSGKEFNETPEHLAGRDPTYNPKIDKFACTPCWIEINIPMVGKNNGFWRAGESVSEMEMSNGVKAG